MNDLYWITRHYKQIITPNLIFDDLEDYGGYFRPQSDVYYDACGKDYDMTKGVIVISSRYLDLKKNPESTIAHEWRHHWQQMNGWKFYAPDIGDRTIDNYANKTIYYYQNSRSETDAYMFETKFAKGSDCLYYKADLFGDKSIILPVSSYL